MRNTSQRVLILNANLKTGNYQCFIRVERYIADGKGNLAVEFFAEESNYPKHEGLPKDFKTKMRLNNNCQVHVPAEDRGNVHEWIVKRLEEAYGPQCEIEITFQR